MSRDHEIADLLEKLAKLLRERDEPQRLEFVWPPLRDPFERPMCEACRRGGVCGCYQPLYDSPWCSV